MFFMLEYSKASVSETKINICSFGFLLCCNKSKCTIMYQCDVFCLNKKYNEFDIDPLF